MSWKEALFGEGAGRDLIVSLSVANLWLVRLWLKILPYNEGCNFFLHASPLNTYIAAILNVVTFAVFIFLLVRLCKRREKVFPLVVPALFLITCLLAAYGVGMAYISVARFIFLFGPRSASLVTAACCALGGSLVLLLLRHRRWLARHYAVVPLLFSPYLLVTVGETALAIANVEPSSHFRPHDIRPAAPLRNALGSRVVWVIFDETDYRLCFGKRPAFLALPAFDAFKATALSATAAYSPNDNTQTSLPSLLTGIPMARTISVGASRLDYQDAETFARSHFSANDTIFSAIKKRGGSTALMGWFLPYSRLMTNVDLCHDYSRYDFYTSDSLPEVYLHQWREVVDMRFLPFRNTMLAANQIGIVQSMRADIADAIRNDDASFIFLHYSVPHSPNVYDRKSGSFRFNRDKRKGYFDNLALADRCLAELRKEMEEKGTWDSSLVIVSSDHHWRTNTFDGQLDKHHVPFMVKFPGQKLGVAYNGRFNTILTKDLVLDFVDGKIDGPEAACRWLAQAMRAGRTPIIIRPQQPDAD